jgi:hypothetical protein
LIITVLLRVIIIVRCKGCSIWVLTAFWGTLFQLAISPFSWVDAAMENVGVKVGQMMETEAARCDVCKVCDVLDTVMSVKCVMCLIL